GPWTGGAEGDVHRLRLPYRVMLGEQGFAIIYAHVSQLQLENVTSVHALHPPTPMAAVQRLGRGAAAWRLRQKTCPPCGVRGGSIERHRRLATQQSLTRMTPPSAASSLAPATGAPPPAFPLFIVAAPTLPPRCARCPQLALQAALS